MPRIPAGYLRILNVTDVHILFVRFLAFRESNRNLCSDSSFFTWSRDIVSEYPTTHISVPDHLESGSGSWMKWEQMWRKLAR